MESKEKLTAHLGKNIARVRTLRKKTQLEVAEKLGMSQQQFSRIENSEDVDDEILMKVAEILGVDPKDIKELDFEKVFQNTQNNYDGAKSNASHLIINGDSYNYFYNDALNVEMLDEIKRLNEQTIKAKDELINLQNTTIKNFEKIVAAYEAK